MSGADDQRGAEASEDELEEHFFDANMRMAAEIVRLRAELAETRAAGDELAAAAVLATVLPRNIEQDEMVKRDGGLKAALATWRSVRGDAPTQPPADDGPDTELAAAIAYFDEFDPRVALTPRYLVHDALLHAATIVRAYLDRPAVARTDGQPPAEPGTILHAWQQIARLVGREDTSPASVVDRVAYLAETAPAPADEGGGLYEQLAAIQHDIWAHWMRYLLGRKSEPVLSEPTGRLLRAADIEHWRRQIDTPYAELTEKEKASDREQVDRFWPLLTTTADDEADGLTAEQSAAGGSAPASTDGDQ